MTQIVKSLTDHEVLIAFSALTSEAFVHIHYDQIDQKNHKSLNTLVHVLEESGYVDFATIIGNESPYAVFGTAVEALKAYEFINDHSAAVNATLYYKGIKNKEAETLIHKEFPKAKERSGLLTAFKSH